MGKLKRIKNRFETLEANVNLATKKVEELDEFKESFQELATKFNAIYDNYFLPEQEISEEEIKKQQEETITMMKEVVRSAITDMLNDPENQAAAQSFISQFKNSLTGGSDGLPFNLDAITDESGQVDLVKAAFMWFANKQQGGDIATLATTVGKKRTSY